MLLVLSLVKSLVLIKDKMNSSRIQQSLNLNGSFVDDVIGGAGCGVEDGLEWFDGYTLDADRNHCLGLTAPGYNKAEYDVTSCEEPSRGENVASMTGSLMEQLSIHSMSTSTTHSSSLCDLSIYKNINLFSPIVENPLPNQQFSTDSLDLKNELTNYLLNRNNYTIAFEPDPTNSVNTTKKIYNSNSSKNTSIQTSINPIYVYYPNYTLPDLGFLRRESNVTIVEKPTVKRKERRPRPMSCNDIEELKKKNFSHIEDWDSLQVLLPEEFKFLGRRGEKGDRMEKIEKRHSLQPEMEMMEEIERNLVEYGDFLRVDGSSRGGGEGRPELVNNGESALLTDLLASIHLVNKYPATKVYSQSIPGQHILNHMCPTLYNLLSDGLTGKLVTIFGKVTNTVWRVVEASVQGGPTPQPISELLMRINSEDLLVEGPLKFNAFICGLMNLSLLPAWLTFLRQRERLLNTHYTPSSFMRSVNTANRKQFNTLITNLNFHSTFHLDIFHQIRTLHTQAFSGARKKTTKSKYNTQIARRTMMKRSYSDERPPILPTKPVLPKSKTSSNVSHDDDEKGMEWTKSQRKEGKFKQLQLQWELMASGQERNKRPSRIPRLITSPVHSGQRDLGDKVNKAKGNKEMGQQQQQRLKSGKR